MELDFRTRILNVETKRAKYRLWLKRMNITAEVCLSLMICLDFTNNFINIITNVYIQMCLMATITLFDIVTSRILTKNIEHLSGESRYFGERVIQHRDMQKRLIDYKTWLIEQQRVEHPVAKAISNGIIRKLEDGYSHMTVRESMTELRI